MMASTCLVIAPPSILCLPRPTKREVGLRKISQAAYVGCQDYGLVTSNIYIAQGGGQWGLQFSAQLERFALFRSDVSCYRVISRLFSANISFGTLICFILNNNKNIMSLKTFW